MALGLPPDEIDADHGYGCLLRRLFGLAPSCQFFCASPSLYLAASQENPLPRRRIFPVEGDGKCAVQHSVSVSQ